MKTWNFSCELEVLVLFLLFGSGRNFSPSQVFPLHEILLQVGISKLLNIIFTFLKKEIKKGK